MNLELSVPGFVQELIWATSQEKVLEYSALDIACLFSNACREWMRNGESHPRVPSWQTHLVILECDISDGSTNVDLSRCTYSLDRSLLKSQQES